MVHLSFDGKVYMVPEQFEERFHFLSSEISREGWTNERDVSLFHSIFDRYEVK